MHFSPLNAVSKQKRAMRLTMQQNIQKPHTVPFKRSVARLTDIKNYLSLFPGSNDSNNMDKAELNKILLHTVPNEWANNSYP